MIYKPPPKPTVFEIDVKDEPKKNKTDNNKGEVKNNEEKEVDTKRNRKSG